MSVVTPRGIKNIVDARDVTDTTGAGTDQFSLVWDNGTGKFILVDRQDAAIDHGGIGGLADDDHTQYLLATGTRTGASSQAQVFTAATTGRASINIASGTAPTSPNSGDMWYNGIDFFLRGSATYSAGSVVRTTTIQPVTDSTAAINFRTAAAGGLGSHVAQINTTNKTFIVNVAGATSQGIIVGKSTTMPDANTFLYLDGSSPGVKQRVQRSSGGFAFTTLSTSGLNTATALESTFMDSGLLGDMQSGATPPSLTYFFISTLASPAYNNANFFLAGTTGYMGVGDGNSSPGCFLDVKATTAAAASLRLRPGTTAPTSPNDGDMWKLSTESTFVLYGTNSTTASIVNTLRLRRDSTGTPAANFGAGFNVQLKSSTTAGQDAGRITWSWITATHASRASRADFTTYYTSTERTSVSIGSNATVPLLSFYGGTLVIQQAGTGETTGFTAGSGTAVNDDSTFTGNVGATAYRISDIVKALKNYGLLAS